MEIPWQNNTSWSSWDTPPPRACARAWHTPMPTARGRRAPRCAFWTWGSRVQPPVPGLWRSAAAGARPAGRAGRHHLGRPPGVGLPHLVGRHARAAQGFHRPRAAAGLRVQVPPGFVAVGQAAGRALGRAAGDHGLAALVLPLGHAHARPPPDEEGHPGVLRHPARAGAQLWPGAQRQHRAPGAVGGRGTPAGRAAGPARATRPQRTAGGVAPATASATTTPSTPR